MALTNLTTAQLEQLAQIVKEKELVLAQLAKLDDSLRELESALNLKRTQREYAASSTKNVRSRRRRSAPLQESILKKLESAGATGITVKELATGLGANPGSVAVWFYTTGKKINGIKKIGKGRFALVR